MQDIENQAQKINRHSYGYDYERYIIEYLNDNYGKGISDATTEELKEANCVLILMELSPDVDLDTVEEVSRRLGDYANEMAAIIWASNFTRDVSYRISLIGIF